MVTMARARWMRAAGAVGLGAGANKGGARRSRVRLAEVVSRRVLQKRMVSLGVLADFHVIALYKFVLLNINYRPTAFCE